MTEKQIWPRLFVPKSRDNVVLYAYVVEDRQGGHTNVELDGSEEGCYDGGWWGVDRYESVRDSGWMEITGLITEEELQAGAKWPRYFVSREEVDDFALLALEPASAWKLLTDATVVSSEERPRMVELWLSLNMQDLRQEVTTREAGLIWDYVTACGRSCAFVEEEDREFVEYQTRLFNMNTRTGGG